MQQPATIPKAKKVVTEDYFRVLKERKEIEKRGRVQIAKAAASSSQLESLDSHRRNNGSPAQGEKYGMPHWLSLIDPEMDDEEALRYIELPLETMYLIDKVVRQKAKAGPIGIDNSEFINIEIEEEYKQKNKYINSLVDGGRQQNQRVSEEGEEEDSDGEGEGKENQQHHNQRLLDRLSSAAAR